MKGMGAAVMCMALLTSTQSKAGGSNADCTAFGEIDRDALVGSWAWEDQIQGRTRSWFVDLMADGRKDTVVRVYPIPGDSKPDELATTSASFGRWFVVGKTFSSITDGVYSAGLPPYKKSYTVDTAKFPDAISLIVDGISADRATVCRLEDGKFYASWRRVGPGYRLPNEAPKRKQE